MRETMAERAATWLLDYVRRHGVSTGAVVEVPVMEAKMTAATEQTVSPEHLPAGARLLGGRSLPGKNGPAWVYRLPADVVRAGVIPRPRSQRVTCWRFGTGLEAAAAEIGHTERPGWLTARGWRQVGRNTWGRPGQPDVFSEAAAVREQLRQSTVEAKR